MMRQLFVCMFLLFSTTLWAQKGWTDFVDTYLSQQSEEEHGAAEALLEEWEELHRAPLNINAATREQLLRLPLLDETAVDSILAYRQRRKAFLDLGELMFVSAVSYDARCYLPLFLTCRPLPAAQPAWRELFFRGRNSVETRLDIPLYRRAGYDKTLPDERRYLGNALRHVFRFTHEHTDRLSYGLTVEKDPGEPFAARVATPLGVRSNLPYDYLSFHLAYRTPRNFHLLLGDYRLRVGMGLLLGTTSFASKAQLLQGQMLRTDVRPYRSTNENDYYRGVALRVPLVSRGWQRLSLLAFASLRELDARLRGDTITTLYTTGLHRTLSELTYRRAASVLSAGANLSWDYRRMHLGATVYYAHYSKTVAPALREYNRYYLRGQQAGGFSIDGQWQWGRHWRWAGELAFDDKGHCAVSQTVRYRAETSSDALHLFLQHRSVSARFVAPFGYAMMENSRVANEHGLLLGTAFSPWRKTRVMAYLDAFYFPKARYRSLPKAKGVEAFAEMRWQVNRNRYWLFAYKMKTREETITREKMMEYRTTHRFALQQFVSKGKLSFVPSLRATLFHSQTETVKAGFMASVRASYAPNERWKFAAFAGLFFCDDYRARLYGYEPQLLGMMSFPSYGKDGCRLVMQAQWECFKQMYLAVRYGMLRQFKGKTIGSGLQLIDSPWQNDLSVQLRWKF